MGSPIWTAPRGRSRQRRHDIHRVNDRHVPSWARPLILAALVVVVATLTWRGVEDRSLPASKFSPSNSGAAAASTSRASGSADANPNSPSPWQRDVSASFDAAAREATAGNLTAAQMSVDRGASLITGARVQSQPAAPAYFETAIAQLDRVIVAHPGDARLDEHVNLARMEIAQLRSALDPQAAAALPAANDPSRVSIGAPQSVSSGALVDAASMGGSFIDARLMPHTSELLEPPSSRSFAEGVRVEGLTFAGATQTLDGIRFKNVTFIGTRLRYEGGQVELQNVRFVRCTFGFTTDSRGARLANAVALGSSSLLIE